MIETHERSIWFSCLEKLILNCVKFIRKIIFSKYATNLKMTISQRSLSNLGLLLLSFEFNNFSFIKDILDNIIYTSVSCDQSSHQWQFSILVTWYRWRHLPIILIGLYQLLKCLGFSQHHFHFSFTVPLKGTAAYA